MVHFPKVNCPNFLSSNLTVGIGLSVVVIGLSALFLRKIMICALNSLNFTNSFNNRLFTSGKKTESHHKFNQGTTQNRKNGLNHSHKNENSDSSKLIGKKILKGSNHDSCNWDATPPSASRQTIKENVNFKPSDYKIHSNEILLERSESKLEHYITNINNQNKKFGVYASNFQELILRAGIATKMIPFHFIIMCGGKRISWNESSLAISKETYFFYSLKPSETDIRKLSKLNEKNISVVEMDNAITAEYHRCLLGKDSQINSEDLDVYRTALKTILSKLQSNDENNIFEKDKVVAYLKGLINAIIEIIELKKLKNPST